MIRLILTPFISICSSLHFNLLPFSPLRFTLQLCFLCFQKLETMPYDFRTRDAKRVKYDHPNDSDDSSSDPEFKPESRRVALSTQVPVTLGDGSRKRRGRPPKSSNATSSFPSHSSASHSSELAAWTVLEWMIHRGAAVADEEVLCGLKLGNVERHGIRCKCCNNVMTASNFQAHAGQGDARPYSSIFLLRERSRPSLLLCLQEAWFRENGSNPDGFNRIKPQSAADGSDDACLICGDGGRLFCCDNSEGCASTFHTQCMGLEEVPEGNWFCPYCTCKRCGCEDGDHLLRCIQCNKQFHWGCLDRFDLNVDRPCFCEESCEEIHKKILGLVGIKNELEQGFSWTLVRRADEHSGSYISDEYKRTECHSKLAVAKHLMKECFLSMSDRYTQIDLIENVIYSRGSNYTRINFSNFFTLVLEKDDNMLAAACVRVHGPKIAEMTYIVTREEYRRLGMGKRLLDVIIAVLRSLEVKKLVIPSAKETRGHWKRCGFKDLDESTRKELMSLNVLMFPKVTRLYLTL